MSVLIVSSTGTDVGKTIATAALAACGSGRVAVVKPAQTGMGPDEPGDLAEVSRLSGVTDTHEFARYPDPLSPHHAAAVSGQQALDFATTVQRIDDIAATRDLVLVEGAGGLMVPFADVPRWTLVDVAQSLRAPVLLVVAPGLGTLSHTQLAVDRLADEDVPLAGILLGSWPAEPDLAMRLNIHDLAAMAPDHALAGVLPAGMGAMRDFAKRARAALAPAFGGTFDWPAFRRTVKI
ncbi:MAG: dethiobiotin synthase [Jatrophihabitans sp.]|uniref:dethiobiotin synthase n=1 Tax=Jatrophihabitans sp. TaxID=1932789 RepID=UPI003F81F3C9